MTSVSFVIPAYNEEGAIKDVAAQALTVLRDVAADYELLILDDASKDRTWEILQEIQKGDPQHVKILRHEKNRGIAPTLEELYHAGTKDVVFVVAGDGQYPPEVLRQCIPLMNDHDIVVCARTFKHYTLFRHIISGSFRLLPFLMFGLDLHDPGSIKCMKRWTIQNIPLLSTSIFTEAERVIRAAKRGGKIGVVYFRQEPRRAGKAGGASMKLIVNTIKDLFRCWWNIIVQRKA